LQGAQQGMGRAPAPVEFFPCREQRLHKHCRAKRIEFGQRNRAAAQPRHLPGEFEQGLARQFLQQLHGVRDKRSAFGCFVQRAYRKFSRARVGSALQHHGHALLQQSDQRTLAVIDQRDDFMQVGLFLRVGREIGGELEVGADALRKRGSLAEQCRHAMTEQGVERRASGLTRPGSVCQLGCLRRWVSDHGRKHSRLRRLVQRHSPRMFSRPSSPQ